LYWSCYDPILATPLTLALILPGLLLLDFSNATGSDKVKL